MTTFDVYVLRGQSNQVGGANVSDLSEDNSYLGDAYPAVRLIEEVELREVGGVPGYESDFHDLEPHTSYLLPSAVIPNMGAELSLGQTLDDDADPDHVVVLVKEATSGTRLGVYSGSSDWDVADVTGGLRLWYWSELHLADVMTSLSLLGTPVVRGLFWCQGNGDAQNTTLANVYDERLAEMYEAFCDAHGDVPMVFDQLSPYATAPQGALLRERQEDFATLYEDLRGGVTMIRTEALALRDGVAHYSADAFARLGTWVGEAFDGRYGVPIRRPLRGTASYFSREHQAQAVELREHYAHVQLRDRPRAVHMPRVIALGEDRTWKIRADNADGSAFDLASADSISWTVRPLAWTSDQPSVRKRIGWGIESDGEGVRISLNDTDRTVLTQGPAVSELVAIASGQRIYLQPRTIIDLT